MIPNIIIPILGRYDLLDRCLASIDCEVGEIIIIDNGDELTSEALLPYDGKLRIIRSPSNLGIATSWNLGIKMLPRDSGWIIIGADVYFEPGHLAAWYSDARKDQILLGGNPPWCCIHIGREVVERVGLFCERFHPAYFEDNDYQKRAEIAGVTCYHSPIPIGHDNSAVLNSSEDLQRRNQRTYEKNHQTFQRRWHGLAEGETPVVEEWDLLERCEYSWDDAGDTVE